ncbi:MAG: hypothetical protein KF883_09535 [Thermomicrobiales bacterium]|nr:hypothetical protein [Thermomicrobiales bacterium]
MTQVSIDELSKHTSEIARRVREEGETIDLTDRGTVFARIAPVPALPKKSFEETWAEHDRLAREIGKRWPKGVSAAEAISEDRR